MAQRDKVDRWDTAPGLSVGVQHGASWKDRAQQQVPDVTSGTDGWEGIQGRSGCYAQRSTVDGTNAGIAAQRPMNTGSMLDNPHVTSRNRAPFAEAGTFIDPVGVDTADGPGKARQRRRA